MFTPLATASDSSDASEASLTHSLAQPSKMPRPCRKGASGDNPDRIKDKNDTAKRDKATINRLRMYRGGKPIRNRSGKVVGGELMSKDKAGNEEITATTGRVQPDRRWFGNTRVVGQKELDSFREAMAARVRDPYSFVLRAKSLPMGLLADSAVARRTHLLSAESFTSTFGPKAQRKRVKLAATDTGALAAAAGTSAAEYSAPDHVDRDLADGAAAERMAARHSIFDKGQSKRIWAELYKVLDCSDVVVQARARGRRVAGAEWRRRSLSPSQTCPPLLPPHRPSPGARRARPHGHALGARREAPPHERAPQAPRLRAEQVSGAWEGRGGELHLCGRGGEGSCIYLHPIHPPSSFPGGTRCDLVPTWVTRRWVAALSAEYPTLAYHASLTKPFGKGALIALLRQFGRLHADKKNISVGFIGARGRGGWGRGGGRGRGKKYIYALRRGALLQATRTRASRLSSTACGPRRSAPSRPSPARPRCGST